ncbi:MAG: pyridoxal phosphate-dependent aminotransferase [Candidatus Heimdallarchaeota archaeon]
MSDFDHSGSLEPMFLKGPTINPVTLIHEPPEASVERIQQPVELREGIILRSIKKAERLGKVSPSAMRHLFDIAREMTEKGKTVYNFGLGDINLGLPSTVREALIRAIDEGHTTYGPNAGEIILRQRIQKKYLERYGVDVKDNIVVTCGALESLLDTMMAFLNPGDEFLVHEPAFGYFTHQGLLAGGIPVSIESDPQNFAISADDIAAAITNKTKIFVLNFPTNPTGAILPRSELERIIEVCREHNLIVVSDECYENITYDGHKHVSALEFGYENTIVVNSCSKSLCMTGLRVGYCVTTNPDLYGPVLQVHQYNTASASKPLQIAVAIALEDEDEITKRNLEILQKRRAAALRSFGNIPGIRNTFIHKGAFYLYPSVEGTGMTGDEFSEFSLGEGVVVVPGSSFGSIDGKGTKYFVRISYGFVDGVNEIEKAGAVLTDALENR